MVLLLRISREDKSYLWLEIILTVNLGGGWINREEEEENCLA
jgi:hypothetical protein